MLVLDLLCVAFAALIGYVMHRASLCNVRAVANLIDARDPRLLLSFARAVAWSALVAGTLLLVAQRAPAMPLVREPLLLALAGGFTFGAGAALNGGCSLSTLQRLADGELSMLVTLAGVLAGVAAWTTIEAQWLPARLVPAATPWMRMSVVSAVLLAALWIWALWEIAALRGGAARTPAPRLAAVAATIGIAGGVLYAVQGGWTYTNYLRSLVAWVMGGLAPRAWHGVLLLALLAGMAVSSLQRRVFGLRWPGAAASARHGAAGLLMGVGAALLPGGNDTLLLASIPALSADAVLAYLALLVGIAVVLLGKRPRAGITSIRAMTSARRESPTRPGRASTRQARHLPG